MNAPRPTAEKIRRRAYELYCDRGGRPGYEIDDWLQAEYELTQLPIHKLAQIPARPGRCPASLLANLVQAAVFLGEHI